MPGRNSRLDEVFPNKAKGDKDRLFMLARGFAMFGETEGTERYSKEITLIARRKIIQRVRRAVGCVSVEYSWDDMKWAAVFAPANALDLREKGMKAFGNSPKEALEGVADAVSMCIEYEKKKLGNDWEEFDIV